MKKLFRVVKITNNPQKYPNCAEDTEEFPHLVSYVEDEMDVFVVNASDKDEFYPADEFFYMVRTKSFEAEIDEAKKG